MLQFRSHLNDYLKFAMKRSLINMKFMIKDTEFNWAAGVCINAIKLGDIANSEDGGSPAANYIYGQFSDYI